jgi:transposase
MQPPLFVRPLSAAEVRELGVSLRSRDAFTLRRSQILLASARGSRPSQIADHLSCASQTVRNTLRAFQHEGLGCLTAKSSAPYRVQAVWSKMRDDELRELLHQSPRVFGKPRSTWTLQLIAQVCFERGMTSRELS